MGTKFGEIDVNQILDNEFRIGVLEAVIDRMLQYNPNLAVGLDHSSLEKIREQVTNNLRIKYPNSGIEYKKRF